MSRNSVVTDWTVCVLVWILCSSHSQFNSTFLLIKSNQLKNSAHINAPVAQKMQITLKVALTRFPNHTLKKMFGKNALKKGVISDFYKFLFRNNSENVVRDLIHWTEDLSADVSELACSKILQLS